MQSLTRFFHSLVFVLLFCLAVVPSTSRAVDNAPIPAIAAAANIKFALDDIVKNFTAETGLKVRVSYGSSGNFVAQIQHGAPFEMLLSADERYIAELNKVGFTQGEGVQYAVGRLALVAPKNSPLALDIELNGLKALLAAGQLERFAIANPDHAPYGERARELLKKLGLWDELQTKLILGENASQAAQFAISGSTQGGIIPLSLAIAPQFQALGHYLALPSDLHGPLNQRMALMPKASSTAERFYQYLQSDAARAVFTQYGFGLPVS
ncbi:molybdate ABC transporter substrate-binding protein [Shewanella baltica]|uniref:molybdate ABC transporter substrate-binding protein n=1 Tax=Shewanella baltica TaxID=62322 RepID=UPI00217D417C|nr:molybdate ABC transporter substrate-binding protein [Shewanella baltica]MCS6236583.1 molybdate ABC transporter substrate-binding protein [Shewanella baltica]MCS6260178.1 molybdate ABC transporter substrate-binding protein [Shewanella baltica]MCS6271113.1 molybdate ABC transporter substrate-binding protein [Shewanella baltica]